MNNEPIFSNLTGKPSAYVVSGAGSTYVNKTYTLQESTFNGKSYYEYEDDGYYILYTETPLGFGWAITDSLDDPVTESNGIYYNDSENIEGSNWFRDGINFWGNLPVPTVTAL